MFVVSGKKPVLSVFRLSGMTPTRGEYIIEFLQNITQKKKKFFNEQFVKQL